MRRHGGGDGEGMDRGGTPPPLGFTGPVGRILRPVLAADPGLAQLRMANRTACAIVAALIAEWAFIGATGALEVPSPVHAAASVAAAASGQHHEMLVVAMLLGGLVANLGGINGNELRLTSQLVTIGYIGAAVAAALALGLAIGAHRDLALAVMVALLVVGSAGRRFGPRGAVAGLLLFIGYFYGFFLSPTLGPRAAGWLAAEVGVAIAATALTRVALFRPSPSRDLRLAVASYDARARVVLGLAARIVVAPHDRTRRRAQRWLVRLGEAALIVDGQLTRGATSPLTADEIHRHAFDTEVAVSNLARFADLLGSSSVPGERRAELAKALGALERGDMQVAREVAATLWASSAGSPAPADERQRTQWVVQHRFANAVHATADALDRWPALPAPRGRAAAPRSRDAPAPPSFTPAVTLRGGLLPGSADVSMEAAERPGSRVRLAPYVRTAAQMGVAVTAAIVAGEALDAQRFYWAVIAALLALVGTNTVAEQLRKATYRVAGTLVGVVAGTALVEAAGHDSLWSLVTVVVAMWVGVAFMRANYAVLATAVTISLSQAYLSLGEFSNGLLLERLAETAVGAGAAMLTVVVVLPLRTRRVLDVALIALVRSIATAAGEAVATLCGDPHGDLRDASRAVDAAYQALVATAQPLRLVGWTDPADRVTRQVAAATAARNYARNLVDDATGGRGASSRAMEAGRATLAESAGSLAAALGGTTPVPPFRRAAPLFLEAEPDGAFELSGSDPGGPPDVPPAARAPRSLAVRDLVLLDNALAALADASGLRVERPARDPAGDGGDGDRVGDGGDGAAALEPGTAHP